MAQYVETMQVAYSSQFDVILSFSAPLNLTDSLISHPKSQEFHSYYHNIDKVYTYNEVLTVLTFKFATCILKHDAVTGTVFLFVCLLVIFHADVYTMSIYAIS